jgi:hypothetical protein
MLLHGHTASCRKINYTGNFFLWQAVIFVAFFAVLAFHSFRIVLDQRRKAFQIDHQLPVT